jgi:hypothetical protein
LVHRLKQVLVLGAAVIRSSLAASATSHCRSPDSESRSACSEVYATRIPELNLGNKNKTKNHHEARNGTWIPFASRQRERINGSRGGGPTTDRPQRAAAALTLTYLGIWFVQDISELGQCADLVPVFRCWMTRQGSVMMDGIELNAINFSHLSSHVNKTAL